jgi:ketosteroid isomerase-like protein
MKQPDLNAGAISVALRPVWARSLGALGLCVLVTAAFVRGQARGDEQDIRARREASNAAIARHDAAGIGAMLSSNVVVVTSNSVHRDGREANVQSFEEQFRTRPDVIYRRLPDDVRVFAPWLMASEYGRWTGSWSEADGRISLSGRYFAKWRKLNGEWLIESETYVPETCTGGAYCTRVPEPPR